MNATKAWQKRQKLSRVTIERGATVEEAATAKKLADELATKFPSRRHDEYQSAGSKEGLVEEIGRLREKLKALESVYTASSYQEWVNVECKVCGAKPWTPCHTRLGKPLKSPHAKR